MPVPVFLQRHGKDYNHDFWTVYQQRKGHYGRRQDKIFTHKHSILHMLDTEFGQRYFVVDFVVPLACQLYYNHLVYHGK